MFQEWSYWQNFYNYAKEAVAETIGGGGDSPQFPVEVTNRYYPEKYQVLVRLQQGPLSWFLYLPESKGSGDGREPPTLWAVAPETTVPGWPPAGHGGV
jgi:hypothetical protein